MKKRLRAGLMAALLLVFLVSAGMIRADSQGRFENLSKELLCFENDGGQVRRL